MGILFNDVVINKRSGGLGRRTPDADMVSGLLFNSVGNNANVLENDKIYRLASLDDAKAIGIDQSFDKDGVSAFYQISQFFRLNPSGDLFVMQVVAIDFEDLVKKSDLIIDAANGEIRQLAITSNNAIDFTSTTAAVAAAKTITEKAFDNNRPLEIFIEGKKFKTILDPESTDPANPREAEEYYDLTELNATNVSVVVAMDKEIALKNIYFDEINQEFYRVKSTDYISADKQSIYASDSDVVARLKVGSDKDYVEIELDANGEQVPYTIVKKDDVITDMGQVLKKPIKLATKDAVGYSDTAAVGVLLGAVSKAKVSENIAWIEKFNLTGEGFRSVGFVGGNDLPTEGTQKTLDDFKYIFTRTHVGIAGVYFNDSHTCTEPTSDFTFIESNRTINKASRIARAALLPKVNSPVLVDPDTGTLPPSTVKGFESLCRSALERMLSNEEVSAIDVFVDPQQDILADSMLKIQIEIVPLGTARRIVVDLGFKNPFGIAA